VTSNPDTITPTLLRDWPLPSVGGSKYERGQVVVVGGARRSPGAAMLSGVAALRAGAGRLTLAVAESVAPSVAVALPECGVVGLRETTDGHVEGDSLSLASSDLKDADAVLLGPGLDDAEQTVRLLTQLPPLISPKGVVVLDAFALGVLREHVDLFRPMSGRLVLTPNSSEALRLLGRTAEVTIAEVAEVAEYYGAAVACQGFVCDAEGRRWESGTGTVGLGTSGSGDVLAGIAVGLAARGASAVQATVWATHLHGAAGDRLGASVGYLASELAAEIPRTMAELTGV
jgi:ADP-dependent NAD(P)H-hydrate dehydratase